MAILRLLEHSKGFAGYINLSDLEEMAFDIDTPDKLAKQYQGLLKRLREYMPIHELNMPGNQQLHLYDNGFVRYCD